MILTIIVATIEEPVPHKTGGVYGSAKNETGVCRGIILVEVTEEGSGTTSAVLTRRDVSALSEMNVLDEPVS